MSLPFYRALRLPSSLLCAFALPVLSASVACTFGYAQASGAATSLSAAWKPLGPAAIDTASFGKVAGRVLSIAVDPNDASGNTVYLGTAGGGVWKSTNAAGAAASVVFAPLTDSLPAFSANAGASALPSLAIGAVSVQSGANAVVLAGTGDPNRASDAHYGGGILRSSDGGVTWALSSYAKNGNRALYTFSGLAVSGFAWSTASPSLVVAAITTAEEAKNVGAVGASSFAGLYYSTDAGQTWSMSTIQDGSAIVQTPLSSSEMQGHDVTSVVWDARRKQFYAAVRSHGYYSSVDGVTWTRLASQPGTSLTATNCPASASGIGSANCPIFRGTLAVQPETGDLYALTVDANNNDQGLWQDLCKVNSSGQCATSVPTFVRRIDTGALDTSSSTVLAQGSYTLALDAVPQANGGTRLLVGTADLFRCDLAAGATACTWRNTTNSANGCSTPAGVAANQYAVASAVQKDGTPYALIGNDGGLWRSMDAAGVTGMTCSTSDASHFENLNAGIATGGSIAEVTGFAQHPTDASTLLASTRSVGAAATYVGTWQQLSAGGTTPLIDPNDTSNWFISIADGVNLKHCANGSSCTAQDFSAPATIGGAQVSNDVSLAHPPMLLDPAATSNLLVGTCRLWRGPAADGTLWSSANALSPPFDGGATCTATSPLIRSIAAGGPVAATKEDLAHTGHEVIYLGFAGAKSGGGALAGHLFVTTSGERAGGSSPSKYWKDISLSPVKSGGAQTAVFNPQGFDVASIFVDPHDSTGATVYVTIKGFDTAHLYRSTDFGAHWNDVTFNLPNVSANDVLVDPNDANTVYVAMDTGVYATQNITGCTPASGCWNALGTALPTAVVTQIKAAPRLATGDGREGMLRAATYGRGIWEVPLLSAISVAAPALTASPTTLTFGSQQVGTQSEAQSITLTSTGSSLATISSVVATGDFTTTNNCTNQPLIVNATCTIQVKIAPTATGTRTGLLTVYADVPGGQVTVALSGVATAPASIVLTPLSLTFAATVVNQTAAAQIITVANTGSSTATLQVPQLSGDFSFKANTCGATLAAQTACALSIAFTPTAAGARKGTLTVVDSAGTQTAQLSGLGQAPATDTLSTGSLTFAQQAVGTASDVQQITLTNVGDVPLTLLSAKTSSSDFNVLNGCGASLAARSSCVLAVSFVPTNVGAISATLTFSDQFRSQTIALNGIGVAPAGVSLTPISLTFSATGVGLSAPAQMVTLTNNGGLPLTVSKQTLTGDFALAATTCGVVLAPNSACTFTIVFAPTAAGARTGALVLTDSAPSTSQTVNLSGTGIDFSFAADGLTSATVQSGATATYPLLMKSAAGLSGNVAFSCTGAPAHSLCTVSPSNLSLGSTSVVTATVQTGLGTASVEKPFGWGTRNGILFAYAVPLLVFRKRRRVTALFIACVMFIALTNTIGCGTGRLIPGSGTTSAPSSPTAAGTYTITVTATAAGLTHSVPLTLIVQ